MEGYLALIKEQREENDILQQRVEQLEKGIDDYIDELSWVSSTEEELHNAKIINKLLKIKGSESDVKD